MAEDTIDKAQMVGDLPGRSCTTKDLRIHGWQKDADPENLLSYYGTDGAALQDLIHEIPVLGENIHPDLPYQKVVVLWAVRQEMALTVEDVLCRRTRSILLDAKASLEAAPLVAQLMAGEMGCSEDWQKQQVAAYRKLCQNYLP